MSKGNFTWHPSMGDLSREDLPDPRYPVAQHIGWHRAIKGITEFHTPEPDNFNRAIMAQLPIESHIIKDNVFYRDLLRDRWWSLYYVPADKVVEFDTWLYQQPYELIWRHSKAPVVRPRKPLLFSRINYPEMTLNERLHTLGYYDKFKIQLLPDDEYWQQRLGPARYLPEQTEDAV